MDFLIEYLRVIAFEWATALAAILTVVGSLEFYWKPLIPSISAKAKLRLAVILIIVAQASAYRALYDRTGRSKVVVEGIAALIDRAEQLKVYQRRSSPRVHDFTDPTPAVAWEADVCAYLTKVRDRSWCTRFKSRLTPLANPDSQRRDTLEAAIDRRIERLEQIQVELGKP